jgi:signal peptidase II
MSFRFDRSVGISLGLGLLAFALDRVHKFVALEIVHMPINTFAPVTNFFDYGLVMNSGISYGLLSTLPVPLLGVIAAIAIIALGIWWVRTNSTVVRSGLALCIGGALSNALDRWIYGAVADFFHFYWQQYSFYIFNIADTAITLGVALLLLDVLGVGRHKPESAKAARS